MRKPFLILIFLLLNVIQVQAQETIFLPIISKDDDMAIDPKIIITDGTIEVDLLQGGWKLADPYWNPRIAQYKGGGTHVNTQLAEGQRLVHREYDNVIETIPLSVRGFSQAQAMKTIHEALGLLRQAGDYWTQPYEYDPVWIEVKLPCDACLTGYSRLVKGSVPELTNPFGQPFFSSSNESVMEGITLTIEREPFWQITKPGEIIGPLYNLIDNPGFELWNFGVADSQPDSWDDLETTHIIGTNNRDQTVPKWGQSDLKIRVSGSTLAGAAKGVTQIIESTRNNTEYTIIAWVRSEGVSNGVGRILVNYSSQLELYRSGNSHGWTLYTGKITTGGSDIVSISCEILTTAANTDGTIYIDGLMFIEGDWEQEASDDVLPYLSGSNIVNHSDSDAGDINWIDIWNIPGNVDSLVKLEFINNNADTSGINYNLIRVGMRRTGNIFLFDNIHDPDGVVDANSSKGDSLSISGLSSDWRDITTKIIQTEDNTVHNMGRYRLLARVKDDKASGDSDLDIRTSYWLGSNTVRTNLDKASPLIIGDWTIVDLTKNRAVNVDKKFDITVPSQIGYAIQMNRDESDDVNFDYFIIMPTDGGYIDIDFGNNILFPQTKLIIDNTENVSIQATDSAIGYRTAYSITDDEPITFHDFKEFLGDVYASGGDFGNDPPAFVHRYKNNQWTEVFTDSNSSQFENLEVYNGELYTGDVNTNEGKLYKTIDGTVWIVAYDSIVDTGATFSYQDFQFFQGLMWIAYSNEFDANGHLGTWDGTTFVKDILVTNNIQSIGLYENKLYLGTTAPSIIEFDTSTSIGTIVLIPTGTINKFTNFAGKLYGVENNSDGIVIFDGDSWTTVNLSDFISPTNGSYGIASLNNRLYASAIFGALPTDGGILIVSDDEGLTWQEAYDESDNYIWSLGTLQGVMYISVPDGIDTAYIKTLTDTETFYNLSDYKGTSFFAPSRDKRNNITKRHRYFFSYDRENFINNIDDKALIGIGFVPRYLELPMCE